MTKSPISSSQRAPSSWVPWPWRSRTTWPWTWPAHVDVRAVVRAQSTDLVKLDVLDYDATSARNHPARREVEHTVFLAFSQPTYKLFVWMAEAIPAAVREKERAEEEVVDWVVRYSADLSRQTGGFTIVARDPKTNELMGAAVVARPPTQSSFAPLRALQALCLDTLYPVWRMLMSVGIAPALKRVATYGTAYLFRFLAVDQVDGARQKAMFGHGNYLHLMQLATHPAHQGKGVGAVVLRAVGTVADELGVRAYLETDEPHLRRFYEKTGGFECAEEYVVRTAAGGSVFSPNYAMVRRGVAE